MAWTRREFLRDGAAAIGAGRPLMLPMSIEGLVAMTLAADAAGGVPPAPDHVVFRGNGQGFRIAAQGFIPAPDRAQTYRLRQFSHVPFRRSRLVLPLTYPANSAVRGYIAGTTLTVAAMVGGTLNPGAIIRGPGLKPNTQIVQQIDSHQPRGLLGGAGTYAVSTAQTAGTAASPIAIAAPIADTFFPFRLTFQAALESRYATATSGITSGRPNFTFGGKNFVTYDPATWDRRTGHIVSDILDPGVAIPADVPYGIWLTVELPAAAANQIPFHKAASSFFDRHEGRVESRSASQIADNFAATATSVTPWAKAQAGMVGPFTPAMLLIEVPPATRAVAVAGDSIGYGSGEGAAGSASFGDGGGSADGDLGYVERGIVEAARLNEAVNIARGSDRATAMSMSPGAWKYRLQLLALSNPTAIVNQMGHNDISAAGIYFSWTSGTTYPTGAVLLVGGSVIYLVVKGGRSGATPPAAAAPGAHVTDGEATLVALGDGARSAAARSGFATFGAIVMMNRQMAALLPGVPIANCLITPDALSTDTFRTAAGQTPAPGWGDASSARGTLDGLLRARPAILGADRIIDPNAFVEGSRSQDRAAGTDSGVWLADGTNANLFTPDKTHLNSRGAAAAAKAVAAALAR